MTKRVPAINSGKRLAFGRAVFVLEWDSAGASIPSHCSAKRDGIESGMPDNDGSDCIESRAMFSRNPAANRVAALSPRHWSSRLGVVLIIVLIAAGAIYVARRSLLIIGARTALNHASALVAQERADGVAVLFTDPPPPWITPMKNQMNEIWEPIKATGVNYYTFGGPRTWLTSYSERSNPLSPYYQAWVGAYVIKMSNGSVPADLQALAWQVTALDQRSWLSAMGDPNPVGDPSPATRAGDILIDGHTLPLWHGTMQSHSDLNAHPGGPLPTLLGMPPTSLWPRGLESFHAVTLDGYFAGWVDTERGVSIVVYGVAADYAGQPAARNDPRVLNEELLTIMRSARFELVH